MSAVGRIVSNIVKQTCSCSLASSSKTLLARASVQHSSIVAQRWLSSSTRSRQAEASSSTLSDNIASTSTSTADDIAARYASNGSASRIQAKRPPILPNLPPESQPFNLYEGDEPNPIVKKALGLRTRQVLTPMEQAAAKRKEMKAAKVKSAALQRSRQEIAANAPSVSSAQQAAASATLINDLFERSSYSATGIGQLPQPVAANSARGISVIHYDNFARQYRRLMSGVIAVNNIKLEQRFLERYEKPKYLRQRLQSNRHRRRFAHEVALKVSAVMKAKRQGM